MKKALSSFSDLFELNLQTSGKKTLNVGSSLVLNFSCSLTNILKTSQGRDKICAIIQYYAEFYSSCLKHSNIEEEKNLYLNNLLISGLIASRLKDSLSQARKIFRFLKFFGELKQIKTTINSKKKLFLKFILSFSHAFSFFYYILDNILWLMNVGIFRDILSSTIISRVKEKKNIFSLMKVLLQIILSMLFYYLRTKKEKHMNLIMLSLNSKRNVKVDSEAYDICRAIIRQRNKKRTEGIDVFLSLLRLLMLAKSLKFIKLNPIFVAFCGIVSSTISLSKVICKLEPSSKIEQIEVCEDEKETEAENGQSTSKMYRTRKLKSSSLLISSSLMKINYCESSSWIQTT